MCQFLLWDLKTVGVYQDCDVIKTFKRSFGYRKVSGKTTCKCA